MKKVIALLTICVFTVLLVGCGNQENITDKPIKIKNVGKDTWSKESIFKAIVKGNKKTEECIVISSPMKNSKCELKASSCFDDELNNTTLGTVSIEKNKTYISKQNKKYKIQEMSKPDEDIIELKNKKDKETEEYCYYSISKKEYSEKYNNVLARFNNRIAYPDDNWGPDEVAIEDLFVDNPLKKSFASSCMMEVSTNNGEIISKEFNKKDELELIYYDEGEEESEIINVNYYSDEELLDVALKQYKIDYGDNQNINPFVDGVQDDIVSIRMMSKGESASSTVAVYDIDRTTGEATEDKEYYLN